MICNFLLFDPPYRYEQPPAVANTAAAANINANVDTEPLGPTSAPDTGSMHPWLSSLDTPGNLDDDAESFGSDIPYEGKSQELSQSTGTVQNGPGMTSQAPKRHRDESVSSKPGNKRTTISITGFYSSRPTSLRWSPSNVEFQLPTVDQACEQP
ncbi:hypothetical protein N7519_008970 [Penicillium mononematosum]|uniref:uncharacterized protein n=1 Tax=Penicillium mononematosum TaxID=268346 RepID=UPI002546D768|nr:uncharacterized protein N7519_008970 [Penicillium mononematosum]KAJ6178509.1 hypothetical protein N7519_008970 [Penicillium mononematosum]